MDLMVSRFVVLQLHMRSPLFGLQTRFFFFFFFAWSFLKVSTTCLRTAKALASLRLCASSPEPVLFAYVISTLFSRAGSVVHWELSFAFMTFVRVVFMFCEKVQRFCCVCCEVIVSYSSEVHMKANSKNSYHLSQRMSNLQNGMCAQRRLSFF